MTFNIGECVVHPAHGLGYIVQLEEKRFFEPQARLYYQINIAKGVVWVPVEQPEAGKLRRVVARDELGKYRRVLKSQPAVLNPDRRQRQLELSDRLKEGSFQAMCEVVRDLTARSWRNALSEPDLASLRRTQENVCQEWAMAAGISLAEAAHEVEALLEEARQAFRD